MTNVRLLSVLVNRMHTSNKRRTTFDSRSPLFKKHSSGVSEFTRWQLAQ